MSTIRYNPYTPSSTAANGPRKSQTASSAALASSAGSCNGGGSTELYNASYDFGSAGGCGSTGSLDPKFDKIETETLQYTDDHKTNAEKYLDELHQKHLNDLDNKLKSEPIRLR